LDGTENKEDENKVQQSTNQLSKLKEEEDINKEESEKEGLKSSPAYPGFHILPSFFFHLA